MPFQTKEVPAQLFLSHNGVNVYHTYKDNNIDQPPYNYHYVLNEELPVEDGFDVRELNAWKNNKNQPPSPDEIEDILIAAIDSGELKPYQSE